MDTNLLIKKMSEEGAQKPLPDPVWQTVIWLIPLFIWLSGFCVWFGFRQDLSVKLQEPFYVVDLILLGMIAVFSAYGAFCLSRPDEYQKPRIKYAVLGVVALWAVLTFIEDRDHVHLEGFMQSVESCAFNCPLHILLFSLLPAFIMFLYVKKGATLRRHWEGSMVSLSVAAVGYMMMRLVEPNDDPMHLFIWHILPVLLICMAGMIVGRFFLRWKSSV